jgi:diguanylate cyclase (GGDEF)-like protein
MDKLSSLRPVLFNCLFFIVLSVMAEPLNEVDVIDLEALDELAYQAPEQLLKRLEDHATDLSAGPMPYPLQVIKAKALYYSNRFSESQTTLITVEAAFNDIDDHIIKELTLRFMGQNFYRMGGFDQAMSYAFKAKLIADEHDLVSAKAQITNMIAAIHLRSDEHDLAKKYFTEALSSFEKINAMNDVAKVNNNLAAVYIETEDFDQAKSHLTQALRLANELNRPTTYMSAIVNQIELQVKMGQFEAAQRSYQDCLDYADSANLSSYQVWCLEAGVELLQEQDKYNEAITIAEQAFVMAAAQNLSQSQINVGKVLIELYKTTGQYEQALKVSTENLSVVEAVKAQIMSLKLEEVKALNEVKQTQSQLQFEREQNKLILANQRLTVIGLAVLIPVLLITLYLLRSKKKVLQALHKQQQHTEDALDAMRIAKEANERLAKTDALTGLYNRREMVNVLAECHEQNNHQKHVMMLDVDWFKRINDDYGHAVGDQVLQQLSQVIQKWLPDDAHCARWGGEEFLVLIQGLTTTQTEQKAISLLEQVAQIKTDAYPELTVSLSAGLCEYQDGLSVDQWIHKADEALYESKANGRNQLTVGY